MVHLVLSCLCIITVFNISVLAQDNVGSPDQIGTSTDEKIGSNCVWKKGPCWPRRGQCGRGLLVKELTGENCPEKKVNERCKVPCNKRGYKKRLQGKLSLKKAGIKGCTYSKGAWMPCNPRTNRVSRVFTLNKGSPVECPPTKTVKRLCNRRSMNKYKRKYRPNKLNPHSKKGRNNRMSTRKRKMMMQKRCRFAKNPQKCKEKKRNSRCMYKRGDWQPCDPDTNMKTRTLTFYAGPLKCPRTKTKSKRCKKSKMCKYTKGSWSGCVDGSKTRSDTLKIGPETFCNATRNITKPCKIKACHYNKTGWSVCDPISNSRNKSKILVSGDPSECRGARTIVVECSSLSKKDFKLCTFGKWGKFNPCQNGVRTKTRPVVSGPPYCQRRAAKTKPCRNQKQG